MHPLDEEILHTLTERAQSDDHPDDNDNTSSLSKEELVLGLLLRAEWMAERADFDSAFMVALMIIQLEPTLALGYHCAGRILAQQGIHKHAIRIYDAGISHALSNGAPGYV